MHTIIHIGAGQACELPQWLEAGAKQIVLVEPNPELAEQLRQRTTQHTQVTVVEAAITTEPANNQLREYNLPEANGLRVATGLKELFPGLKVLNTHAVATITPAQLLEQFPLTSSQPASLILQAAGEEHQILQALIKTDQLKCFSELNLHANPEPYYKGSVDAEKTLNALTNYGYDIANENQQDPDWPSWILTRNPLKDQINALQVENEKLRTERQELGEKHQQTQQQLEKLKAQHEKTLQASKAQTEELSACTQQRDNAQNALAEEQAAHKKTSESLEEHKQWFLTHKQQAEQLQVELSEAKEQRDHQETQNEKLRTEHQELDEEHQQTQQQLEKLKAQHEQTLQASKAQTEELSACTQQRDNAQNALAEEQAAHKKTSESLEEHKQWFLTHKQQAEQLQGELSEAKEQRDHQKKQNEKLRTEFQELDEKHQQTRQQLAKLKAQHEKTLQASKAQTEELSACTQQRGEAQKALTEELAAHKKTSESLEEHKQWFRSRKQQAEQLQVELSEAKEQCAVLKIELEALKQEKQQILQSQNLSQNAVSQLEQKMEQLFSQQAGQLQQTANALGQHVTRSFQGQRQHIQNVASLGQYFESGAQPLEFGQWAIGADLATHLIRAIEQNNYDLIIEFGSGTSTVLMARALLNQNRSAPAPSEQNALTYDATEPKNSPLPSRERGRGRGGAGHSDHTTEYDLPKRILSFEQTKAFQQKTATALSHEGLTSLVDLVLAPLVPMPANSHQSNAPLFYDCATQLARVAQLFEGRQARILILVDGPHSPDGNPQAREPALGCLLQHLSAHQLDIILDDSNRQGEQQVLEAWKSTCEQRGLNCQHEQLNTEKGATWLTVAP